MRLFSVLFTFLHIQINFGGSLQHNILQMTANILQTGLHHVLLNKNKRSMLIQSQGNSLHQKHHWPSSRDTQSPRRHLKNLPTGRLWEGRLLRKNENSNASHFSNYKICLCYCNNLLFAKIAFKQCLEKFLKK